MHTETSAANGGVRSDIANHANKQFHNQSSNSNNGRSSQRSSAADSVSRLPSIREVSQLLCEEQGKSRSIDVDRANVRVSGILYKWVNYGKGWRPRWFVLQDGVLSYYKIHGPNKIVVSQVTQKGLRLIGEMSLRRISLHKGGSCSSQLLFNPIGEVHLKVSSICESKWDSKRFTVFTGTKMLHLRAETQEDRQAWMQALQSVKEMFPRMSNSELMAPLDKVGVSTETLRLRLLEEGVSEAVIDECEQIMTSEFVELQKQLMLLKQKNWRLIDMLQQLEVHVMTMRKHHANRIWESSSLPSGRYSAQSSAFQSPKN
ncbi:oxysterol-binding protein-related protein 1C [Cornus florida]|uniref:oxysterol-binding protein-related protein 1C n=1 Tax=Cornus florida TaxID=4283 RepID=UPI00289EA7F2|nr:oxysterol-binding protein-related protein 1C [Cornus florida]